MEKITAQQSGRSMVEMLAVLMIIGVLVVGAVAGLEQGMQKFKVEKMHTDIQSISSEVVNLYAWKRGYPDSSADGFMQTLCTNDIFPDGCSSDGQALNPFGGEYLITTDTENQTLRIEGNGLPEDACDDLTIKEWAFVVDEPDCENGVFTITFE